MYELGTEVGIAWNYSHTLQRGKLEASSKHKELYFYLYVSILPT